MAIVEKKIILHRGLFPGQEFPNSMEIFAQVTPGTTIEFDVFQLRDGALAVIHNKDFDIRAEEVEQMDTAAIKSLHVRGRISGAVGKSVPMLSEFVEQAAKKELPLWCEIKGSTNASATQAAQAAVRFFAARAYPHTVHMLSFSLETLGAAKEEMKRVNISLPLILSWTSSSAVAEQQEITRPSVERAQRLYGPQLEGDHWSLAAVAVAHDIGCAIVSLGYDWQISTAAVRAAHVQGLQVVAPITHSLAEAEYYFAQSVDFVTLEEI